MKAIDILHRDNMVLLYCGGDDISADFKCKKNKDYGSDFQRDKGQCL